MGEWEALWTIHISKWGWIEEKEGPLSLRSGAKGR